MSDISRRNDALMEIAGQANAALESELTPDPGSAGPHCACGCTGCGAGRSDQAGIERLRRIERHARDVMAALEQHGAGIVGHLLDDDDNSGEYLRRALSEAPNAT